MVAESFDAKISQEQNWGSNLFCPTYFSPSWWTFNYHCTHTDRNSPNMILYVLHLSFPAMSEPYGGCHTIPTNVLNTDARARACRFFPLTLCHGSPWSLLWAVSSSMQTAQEMCWILSHLISSSTHQYQQTQQAVRFQSPLCPSFQLSLFHMGNQLDHIWPLQNKLRTE